MPEARFLKIVILILLLLNLGTLGYLWLNSHERHHHMPPPPRDEQHDGRRGAAAFLHDELSLNDEQEAAYKKMREVHHATVLDIRSQMKESKQKLYQLMQQNQSSSEIQPQADAQLDSLAAQQRRIERITYEHFRDLRSLCTPMQQKRFDAVIEEALEQMR